MTNYITIHTPKIEVVNYGWRIGCCNELNWEDLEKVKVNTETIASYQDEEILLITGDRIICKEKMEDIDGLLQEASRVCDYRTVGSGFNYP